MAESLPLLAALLSVLGLWSTSLASALQRVGRDRPHFRRLPPLKLGSRLSALQWQCCSLGPRRQRACSPPSPAEDGGGEIALRGQSLCSIQKPHLSSLLSVPLLLEFGTVERPCKLSSHLMPAPIPMADVTPHCTDDRILHPDCSHLASVKRGPNTSVILSL